ncbi:ribonuclease P protein component [Pontibacter sp. G13]|uniref:ribonuclease P protein component n=1 Tax=Pontibacter sp. G13 TaxID=3074898 RepID=UPI00288BF624|nr:ribonuclease P protein component [Pontibacter sp. G13]WNJ16480.1 ribonuclease P protein component [Pontibacter sp. G13]
MAQTPNQERFTLSKDERLCSRKAFDHLFEHGSSLRVGVLKFYFVAGGFEAYSRAPVSVAFAAPKRSFKRAVDRNFLKRRMKEAYRLQKHPILQWALEQEAPLAILILYTKRYKASSRRIHQDTAKGLSMIVDRLSPPTDKPQTPDSDN